MQRASNKLRAGLYLRFERGKDLLSRLVSLISCSYYTHVDLVLSIDPPEYFGALPGQGVVLHQNTECDAECFIKLSKPIPFEKWYPELGKQYDWQALARVALCHHPQKPVIDPKRWYCTELVAYLLGAIWVKPFFGIITPDSLLTWVENNLKMDEGTD